MTVIARRALIAVSVFLCFGPAAVFSASPLQPVDIFELELALDPRISPDGNKVLYSRQSADIMTDSYYTNLWLVDIDSGEQEPLTTGREWAGNGRWSPDGKRIVYTAARDGVPQLYIRWLDSGLEKRLTSSPTPVTAPAWSPDGRYISYIAKVPEAPPVFGTMPAAPPGAQWQPGARVITSAFYRHDGLGYDTPGTYHLFVVPADGGADRRISTLPYDHGGPTIIGRPYAWTADSSAIVSTLHHKTEQELLHSRYDTGLYRVPVEGGETTVVTDRHGPEISPALSPDGKRIAYVGYDDNGRHYQVARLYIADLDGGNRRALSTELDRDVELPVWAPDGRHIYAYYVEGGVTRLALFDLKGGHRVLAEGLGSFHTAYSAAPTFSVADNGRFAMQWSRPDNTGNILVGDTRREEQRIVTHLNENLFKERSLGNVESVKYTSSRDGLEIEGWIVYPPNFDPKERYPLILEIHGGPTTSYGARFDIEKQLMAAAGYVVLYVNPRGSTGYGATFGDAIHNAFPGNEYEDLLSGVDALLARGFIDPEQLFVTGGSGGGMLTAGLVGHTQRFRAAASLYPVIDWATHGLTSDIMSEVFNRFFDGSPWEQPESYRRRSMLEYVPEVSTPTLVMCGESDFRTPISEAEMYFAALKWHGVETALVRVPGEPHGIRATPSHFVAKILNVVGWFDHHKEKKPPST